MDRHSPYISVIVVSRNDGYGGNLVYRLQNFLISNDLIHKINTNELEIFS